jgi:hypothetical protein
MIEPIQFDLSTRKQCGLCAEVCPNKTLTRNAPTMILFLADRTEEDISQDISIAATYGMLAAHSLGLVDSIMDIIPPAINKDPELRKLFSVPDHLEVVTSIIIGYPKYKYQRGIKRSLKSVEWLN